MDLRDIGRPLLWFVIGLAVAAVPLLMYRSSQQNEIVVRSYSVPPEIAREMRTALYGALAATSKDGAALGSVSQTPDGHLLVSAPESVQRGIQEILAQVAAKKPPPTPAIRFELWMVAAVPGASAPEDEQGLAEVRPALADIQKSKGPLRFELIENLALQARSGFDNSQVQGALANLEVAPSVRYDEKDQPLIAARMTVRVTSRAGNPFAQGELRALTELRPGQLLVIGQSTMPGKAVNDRSEQIYYIVRASL